MSSRLKQQNCRVCGGDLQGNQRRWLYGGQKHQRGSSSSHATPDASTRGSRPGSALSSPWGSTLSLGSLSSSQMLPSPAAKATDLLSILTHITGQPVSRGSGQREFLCGKCASLLERVFKFDTVINRVKLLSSERLQKLKQERDKIRQWVRNAYQHTQPKHSDDPQGKETCGGVDGKEGYRSLLRDNLALSEYECWSEKSDSCCPYFQRTGKQCKRGKNCQVCHSLRVSDSDYESVCGIPRNLPFQPFSPLALSRDKSQSMPLHWSREPSVSCSPTSGSCLSLRYQSVQSLDSLDDGSDDLSDWRETPTSNNVHMDAILRELKCIPWKPINSPVGSRIPVLGRGSEGTAGEPSSGLGAVGDTELVRKLDFGEQSQGDAEGRSCESTLAPLEELQDEFLPLHKVRPHQLGAVIKHLQEQLNETRVHIKTSDPHLRNQSKSSVKTTVKNRTSGVDVSDENASIQKLSHMLHTSVNLIQECVGLKDSHGESGPEIENAASLTTNISEAVENIQEVIKSLSDLTEREQDMEREITVLKREKREREADLAVLTAILQSNQDIINDMHMEMVQERDLQQERRMESAMSRLRDQIDWAGLQHKEALGLCHKDATKDSTSHRSISNDTRKGKEEKIEGNIKE